MPEKATQQERPELEPENLVKALEAASLEELRAKRWKRTQPLDYCYASRHRECVRWMALDLLHPGVDEISDEGLARMETGNEREVDLLGRLMRVAKRSPIRYAIIEGQRRFEIHGRSGRVVVVGKTDGRFAIEGVRNKPIFEIKSGETARRASSIEDLDRSPWGRPWVDQLLLYLLGSGEPWGLFVLDQPGAPLFLPLRLYDHLERAERVLADCEAAVAARHGETELPPFTEDSSVCRRCPHFGATCHPPHDFGAGARLVHDEILIRAAATVAEKKVDHQEYQRAEKKLKGALRGANHAILGPYQAEIKYGRSTYYDTGQLSDEEKDRIRVTKEDGRMTMKVSRV